MGPKSKHTSRSSDHRDSSGNSSGDTSSDGVLVQTLSPSDGDPPVNEMKISSSPSNKASKTSILQSFDALSLDEQLDLLHECSLTQKLHGRMPFSEQDQQLIREKRLDTNVLDPSRFAPDLSFLAGNNTNADIDDEHKPIIVPPPFSDGTGFRPTSITFRPKEVSGQFPTAFQTMTGDTDQDQDMFRPPYENSPPDSSKNFLGTGNNSSNTLRPPSPPGQTNYVHTNSGIGQTPLPYAPHPSHTHQQQQPFQSATPSQQFQHQSHYHHPPPSQHTQAANHHAGPTYVNNPHPPQPRHQPTGTAGQPMFNHQQQQQPQTMFNNQQQQQPQPMFNHQQQQQPQPMFNHQQQQPQPSHQSQQPFYNTANRMPQGTPHGFMLRTVPRSGAQADYDNDRVVIPRTLRGSTTKERAKIRELCTTPITPQITRSNITKLISSDSNSNYDIAEDAAQWQTMLRSINRHAIASDFKHIIMIPLYFDEKDPTTYNASAPFVNAILDHDQLTDDHYKRYQRFLRRFGRDEEITSDAWFEEKLWKSLSPALHSEVLSDFIELDKDDDEDPNKPKDSCQGSLTLLHIIINRVVQSNQESRRSLEEYIRNFDIRKFPGEDVTAASLRIKAVARSLGTTNLPSDIIHRVLEGFARASTPMFQSFCATQESLITSSLVRDRLTNKDNIYKMLVNVLADLEVRYADLRSGQRWLGHGHGTTISDSVFLSSAHDGLDDDDVLGDDDDYAVYITSVGRHKALPFDVWVRDKNCHHCGELGHIRPQCPNRKDPPLRRANPRHPGSSSNHYGHGKYDAKSGSQRTHPSHQRSSKTYPTDGKQYAKKVLTAALELVDADDPMDSPAVAFLGSSAPVETSTTNPTTTDGPSTDQHQGGEPSKYTAFLAALGCPKE